MKTHEFTPEQSERILNAVYSFVHLNEPPYIYIQHINSLLHSKIINFIEYGEGDNLGKDKLHLTPLELNEALNNTSLLCDLLFRIQKAVDNFDDGGE